MVVKMKRIKVLLVFVCLFGLTGCANTLKCSIETSNYDANVKIKFKDDKPISYKYKDVMRFSENSSDAEIYYHSKYNDYSNLISDKLAHVRNKPVGVFVKINYDFNKNNSLGESTLLIERNDTKKIASEKIESLGYTCK